MSKKKDAKKARRLKKGPVDLAALGKRVQDDPVMREFPTLGWAVILVPLDLMESRVVARMMIGTLYDFQPDELIDLRARRITMDGEAPRIWWVMAVSMSVLERKRGPKE